MSARFITTSTHALEGQTCTIAKRVEFDAAVNSIVRNIEGVLAKLQKSFDIEHEDLLVESDVAAMRSALGQSRRLELVEGSIRNIDGIAPDRMARLSCILNSTYEIEPVA